MTGHKGCLVDGNDSNWAHTLSDFARDSASACAVEESLGNGLFSITTIRLQHNRKNVGNIFFQRFFETNRKTYVKQI